MTEVTSSTTPADANAAAPRQLLLADIGGSQLRIARLGAAGAVELLHAEPTPAQDWGRFCASLRAAVQRFAGPHSALSISIAGVVDPGPGHVSAANLPCLAGRPLARELAALLGLPVRVSNDAHCAALAEARLGAGVGHGVVFCVVLGTGVGGALVVNGQLVQGAGGLSGEWGHGPVINEALLRSGDGRQLRLPRLRCACGLSGCANTVGGARGLERLHAFLHREAVASSRQILADWGAGEASASATVAAYIELLSGPLAMAVNLSGASVLPVCGGLGRDAALIAALDRAVRPLTLRRSDAPLLVPSALNDQAGLIGAAFAYEAAEQGPGARIEQRA